jgi:SagB-type dehydrogenase family enzyme
MFFDDAWQAADLDSYSVVEFARRMNAYTDSQPEHRLDYPAAPTPLPRVNSSLTRLARRRHSQRSFSDQPLTRRDVAAVVQSLAATDGPGHRAYPAAGALYVTEALLIPFRVRGLDPMVYYYDPLDHGLVKTPQAAPDWPAAQAQLNISVTGQPQALLLVALRTDRVTAKYGERGGRFALLEAGAAMQQVQLAIAARRHLRGVVVGGVMDSYWLRVLGLEAPRTRLAFGQLIGR